MTQAVWTIREGAVTFQGTLTPEGMEWFHQFIAAAEPIPEPAPDPPDDPKIGDEPAPDPPVEDDDDGQ